MSAAEAIALAPDWPGPTRPMPDACWLAPADILVTCQHFLRQDPVCPEACLAIANRVEELAEDLCRLPPSRSVTWEARATREIELAGMKGLIAHLRRAAERQNMGTAA